MGRQRNASCSSGGNGTRGSQPAGSERNASSCSSGGLGWNRLWKRGLAYRETEETALCSTGHVRMGSCSSRGVCHIAKWRKRTSYGQNRVLLIRRGVAYRKMEETDLCWSTYGRNGVMFTHHLLPRSSLHGLPSTSSSHHGLLFIQPPPRATPPATVQPPLHGHPSTVYCSSSPPHHGVLFIQRQRHRSLFIPEAASIGFS